LGAEAVVVDRGIARAVAIFYYFLFGCCIAAVKYLSAT
jgi:hypothetical protein